MQKFSLLACLLACMMLTGCVSPTVQAEESLIAPMDAGDMFKKRDLSPEWNSQDAARISLQGENVRISQGGVYLLSGTLENGQVVVDAPKDEKVQLVLMDVAIHCQESAAIYILQADKVFITLAPGTENRLSSGETFCQTDENNVDAPLFSKADLTLNGEGTLYLSSPGGHGAVCKDTFRVTGGRYIISAAGHGMEGKDSLRIAGGDFQVTAGKDGLRAENEEDGTLGFVYIAGGDFRVEAGQDGISASGAMEITGGRFDMITGGGSTKGDAHSPGPFGPGGFGGNRGGERGRQPGGWSEHGAAPATETTGESQTDTSKKGLKAGGNLLIQGGQFALDCADDAIHANLNTQVDGGIFTLKTGDDGLHADETLSWRGGELLLETCYEGLEALHLIIQGGQITLTAEDDGLNAAGGTDQSGFGGTGRRDMFGGRGFGSMNAGNGSIRIVGGTLHITASGDGIDANGSLQIDDGQITVCGPASGDTASLDYDTTGEINGGIFLATGARGMAHSFSGGSQSSLAIQVSNASAGTVITIQNAAGATLLSYDAPLAFGLIIFSSPDIISGQQYTLQVGNASGTFTAP